MANKVTATNAFESCQGSTEVTLCRLNMTWFLDSAFEMMKRCFLSNLACNRLTARQGGIFSPVALPQQDTLTWQSFLVQFQIKYHGKRRVPYEGNVLAIAFQTS